MAKSLENKLKELRTSIRKLDSALAAFSGEVDNSFLVRILHQELGEKAVALKALSASYPSTELSLARRVARIMDTREPPPQEYGKKVPIPPRSMHTYSSLKSLAMRTKIERSLRKAN
jgi:pyridinium-3,5-biscarboxylic acid mononucleotide sulfurtransferase